MERRVLFDSWGNKSELIRYIRKYGTDSFSLWGRVTKKEMLRSNKEDDNTEKPVRYKVIVEIY